MSSPGVVLDSEDIAEVFPFHLVLDHDLSVVQVGRSIGRVCPELVPGALLGRYFVIERPAMEEVSAAAIAALKGAVFVLQHRERALRLRGELRAKGERLLFLGSPWLTELTEVRQMGLSLDDFASHDSLTDLLFLLQAQKRTIRDAENLADKLKQQQEVLRTAEAKALAAAEAAEKANQAKSAFLAVMSHEIRTPLNGVLGMLDMLRRTVLNADQQHYAMTATKSGKSLLRIINDILDFSKVEAGKFELERTNVDLWELIEDVVDPVVHDAASKGITVTKCIALDVPRLVIGDPVRVRQVLSNYLNNASKFTAAGTIGVAATVVDEADADVVVRIEVRDTGIGIPEEQQQQLFKPFMQVDSSTTRRYGGTGLGLVVCKQLVRLMGGEVGVESEWGAGSTFWFTVRLQKVAVSGTRQAADEEMPQRVLILGNSAAESAIPEAALRAWGAQADVAPSSAAAIELVAHARQEGLSHQVALLNTSVAGWEEVARYAASPSVRLPTILLSRPSHATKIAEYANRAGYGPVLKRPLRLSQLRRMLADQLNRAIPLPAEQWQPDAVAAEPGSQVSINGRVLIADDDPINQEVAALHLESFGLTVDVVDGGGAAVDAALGQSYDLVFMDLQMPDVDGLQATRMIRERQQAGERTPIVAWTASVMAEDRQRCEEAGADAILTKPFELEELEQVLMRFFSKQATFA